MTRNTVMDDSFWRSSMGLAFLKAQAWHEAGKRYPAPDADWIEAQRLVFLGLAAPIPPVKPATPKPTVAKSDKAVVGGAVVAAGAATYQYGQWVALGVVVTLALCAFAYFKWIKK